MARYVCPVCGYVHDDEKKGAPWDALPGDWTCPVCGAAKSQFQPAGGDLQDSREPGADEPRFSNRAAQAHRMFGYVFVAIYIVLLVQMIPRLWSYQIEFPARTVLHIALGMAIAIGTAALIAAGCQQYRICNTGRPELRARLQIDKSARRLENFLRVSTEELAALARLTGNDDVHKLSLADICTTNSEISNHTEIAHV